MYHINIKNFHNNDRPNKIALTILSQLKITKVNIIEKFGKENNRITSENARILKRKENGKKRKRKKKKKKKKERDHFLLCVYFTSMVFLLLP